MSKARHKKASGGRAELVSGNPNVIKEAGDRKNGGAVKRAKGGKAMAMDGMKPGRRGDRPARASGGRVGSDSAPLSSANKVTSAERDND